MTFFVSRGFAELQILKKRKWPYLLNWVEYCDEILHTHWYWHDVAHEIVKWNILISAKFWKKWKWPYPFNWVEYFDKLLRKHWYWQDLAQEIAKWHYSLIEALPSSKFWKSDNGAISWTERNIVIKFCIHTEIDKMFPMRLSNDIWDWLSFCRGSNSEKSEIIAKWHFCIHIGILTRCSPWNCQMTFETGRGFAEVQILKQVAQRATIAHLSPMCQHPLISNKPASKVIKNLNSFQIREQLFFRA